MNFKNSKILAQGDGYFIYQDVDGLYCGFINVIFDGRNGLDFISNLKEVESDINNISNIMRGAELKDEYNKRITSAIVAAMMGYVEEAKVNFDNIKEDMLLKHKEALLQKSN